MRYFLVLLLLTGCKQTYEEKLHDTCLETQGRMELCGLYHAPTKEEMLWTCCKKVKGNDLQLK